MVDKRSFFERLTGSVVVEPQSASTSHTQKSTLNEDSVPDEDAQLTVDVWQTPEEMIVQAIVGGVKPDDLDIQVTHDTVTIAGKRERHKEVQSSDFFYQELYWGSFSRSVLLPQEVSADEAEATIKNGLVTVRLPKLDKNKVSKLKIKNEFER